VRVSPVVTQLVFEHALRIPMKAETSSSPRTAPVVTPDTRSEVTMPNNVSIAGDDVVVDLAAGREDSRQSTSPSSIKGKEKEVSPSESLTS